MPATATAPVPAATSADLIAAWHRRQDAKKKIIDVIGAGDEVIIRHTDGRRIEGILIERTDTTITFHDGTTVALADITGCALRLT